MRELNPCRPGYGASCSFCCGSHNYKLPHKELLSIFSERDLISVSSAGMRQETGIYDKISEDAMQCPYVGITDEGLPGCLAYDDYLHGVEFESFFKGTCRTFFCQAFEVLTDREIIFAAELCRDWFYYSLLINSIDMLSGLSAVYVTADSVPDYEIDDMKKELSRRLYEEELF